MGDNGTGESNFMYTEMRAVSQNDVRYRKYSETGVFIYSIANI